MADLRPTRVNVLNASALFGCMTVVVVVVFLIQNSLIGHTKLIQV